MTRPRKVSGIVDWTWALLLILNVSRKNPMPNMATSETHSHVETPRVTADKVSSINATKPNDPFRIAPPSVAKVNVPMMPPTPIESRQESQHLRTVSQYVVGNDRHEMDDGRNEKVGDADHQQQVQDPLLRHHVTEPLLEVGEYRRSDCRDFLSIRQTYFDHSRHHEQMKHAFYKEIHRGTQPGDEHTANPGPDHPRNVPANGVKGYSIPQFIARHRIGYHGLPDRLNKRIQQPGDSGKDQSDGHTQVTGHKPAKNPKCKRQHHHRQNELHRNHHLPPVDPVGEDAGQRADKQERERTHPRRYAHQ